MKNTTIYTEGETLVLDFITLPTWEDFDSLEKYIVKYFSATLLRNINGPESKVSFFEIENKEISLHNNPYGNSFKGALDCLSIFEKISEDVEKRLSK